MTLAMSDQSIDRLRAAVAGEVIGPDHPTYEKARLVWNGRIDCRPALIVSCHSVDDVRATVDFARDSELALAVRGGAHSTPGYSTCDDGIVIDLQPMKRVEVDAEARTARVQGGAKWLDLDAATQEHGLAVTGGRVSDTGVGGLALGSGSGWLERVYGVTCESLLSAEVVTADGSVVRANADENPDLFWGLRGGGGNFGIVTEFEFRVHPVGPIVFAGMMLFPREQAREVIPAYRDFMEQAPDEVCGGLALITAPPEEFVPEELRGRPAVGIVCCYVGSPDEGAEAFRPLREAVSPTLDLVQPMPYVALQQMLDAGNPTGIREYFKIDWLRGLPDEAIETALDLAEKMPAPFGQLILAPMGGAVSRTDSSALALNVPDAPWCYFCLTMWMDPAEDDRNVAWTRGLADALRPFGIDRPAFPNFIEPDEGASRLRESFGEEKYGRLVELKRKWDPGNLFRLNQNIAP